MLDVVLKQVKRRVSDMRSLQSLLAATLVLVANVSSQDVTVELSQGFIRGSVGSTVSGVTFYSFQGLPYAQPPVGELRFKAPQKAPSWEGVRDASTVGSNCVQIPASDAYGSEDCLFINVYTPQLPDGNGTTSLLPVMVWIHGGAFTSGSGDTTWYGPGYLLDKELLLVTFNYRLGVLGFLGLSHSEVSLNNGLKDQRAALRWVQQNIERFGGDPAQITIFGESAGGASVEYQLISQSASALFQRAISQSGSVLSPWAYVDTATAQTRAQQLIQLLGYTSEDINDIYNFLMEASAENITIQQSNVITERWASDNLAFVPTVEGELESGGEIFLSATPLELIKEGNFTRVPYITGFCSEEGKAFAYNITSDILDQLNNKFERYLPYDLNLTIGTYESQQVAALVRETYFGNETASMATVENYVNFLTDNMMLEGVHRTVNFRLRYNSPPIYVYQFSYEGRLGLKNLFHYNFTFPGAGHADDISYLFTSSSNIELESNSTELSTIERMVTLWTNFAKARDLGEGLDLTWDPVSESKQTYLDINTDLSVQNLLKLHPKRRAVWNFLYREVDK